MTTQYEYAGSLYRNGIEAAEASMRDYYSAFGANGPEEVANLMLGDLRVKQAIADDNGDDRVASAIRDSLRREGDWELPDVADHLVVSAWKRVLKEAAYESEASEHRREAEALLGV